MPERFQLNVFEAETAKLMRNAFEEAWPRVALVEGDIEMIRKLLASAIIDLVNEGIADLTQIVNGAVWVIEVAHSAERAVE